MKRVTPLLRRVAYPLPAYSAPKKAVRERLPWLFITLGAGVLSSIIISLFETTLEKKISLTLFLPVLIGLGGNAGTQALAIVVRGLALGKLRARHVLRIALYEIGTGVALGLVLGFVVGLFAYVWQSDAVLGLIVALSLAITMTLSTVVGAGIPLCLKVLGVDPALASGPFITTTVDAAGLFIYLSLAAVLIQWFHLF